MKTVVVSLFLLVVSSTVFAEPPDDFRRLALGQIVVPRLKLAFTPLDQAIAQLEQTANAAKRGGKPVVIRIHQNSRHLDPKVTLDISGQNLDTLLEFLTEHVGFDWMIDQQTKTIVIFTTPALQEKHPKLIAMPGRPKLRATVVPQFKVEDLEMAKALQQLQIVARTSGVGELAVGAGAMQIRTEYNPRPGQDYLVTGEFRNADVDTIIEILTKQTKKLDWTLRGGDIIVFDKATAEARRRVDNAPRRPKPSSSPADPFADLGGGYVPQAPPPPTIPGAAAEAQFSTESYQTLRDNPFLSPLNEPLSTFSIDVDTASYSNVRRYILDLRQKPPIGAVRIEELINYFEYDYAPPEKIQNPPNVDLPIEHPFAARIEVASSPWKPEHRLVRIGLKGYELPVDQRPPSNLVFLLDVSGSMGTPNKLPLVKESMKLLVNRLGAEDRVAIAVYAGASGLVLKSTPVSRKREILDALDRLSSGGSTNGGAGIKLAYSVAKENFILGGNNRVILCTDGDFNVGTTDKDALKTVVSDYAKNDVQLSIMGFGMGNLKDDMMETLSNHGDGNYGYIDSRREAEKLFVNQLAGTLFMIGKDVKMQIEFNPLHVAAYRLIGYENRKLANRDFADDKVDAGDIGAGHTVTALYEIVPPGVQPPEQPGKIDLKYQEATVTTDGKRVKELLTLKLRYKWPKEDASRLMEYPILDLGGEFNDASSDFQFAAAVAGFGMLLRESPHVGQFAFEDAAAIAKANLGEDAHGERKEFVSLAEVFFW